jgi:ATP-dependent Lhr-like helicase
LPIYLLQAIAICELMLKRWIEPPRPSRCDFSTLVQQVISSIAEMGACEQTALYRRLCTSGPFRTIERKHFDLAIKALKDSDIVEIGPDSKMILGLHGEKIRSRKDFYAAFATPSEFTVVTGDQTLGTIPIQTRPQVGQSIIFAARRWAIDAVDFERQRLVLKPSQRGGKPKFLCEPGEIHREVRQQMAALLASTEEPIYLDAPARDLLRDARAFAASRMIGPRRVAPLSDTSCLWWTWTGTREQRTLMAVLSELNIEALDRGIAIECKHKATDLWQLLSHRAASPIELNKLAATEDFIARRKYDHLVPKELLIHSLAQDLMELVQLRDYIGQGS